MTTHLAMWSGPRNLSTAMMRAFENRPDTAVVDEPLYAHYLHHTGLAHPGREEILASQSTDWREVCTFLTAPPPHGQRLFYQKHMTHHLLPHMSRAWMQGLTHCFLLRRPEAVLSSYIKSRPDVTPADLGYAQQAEIYAWLVRETGARPLVVESSDVLKDPRRMLEALAHELDLPFYEEMLRWPAGPRDSDGVWAPHWYRSVQASTGFRPYQESTPDYPAELHWIVEDATPHYRALWEHRVRALS